MAKQQNVSKAAKRAPSGTVARGVVAKKRATPSMETTSPAPEDTKGDPSAAPQEAPTSEPTNPARREGTKRAMLVSLLQKPDGATVAALGEALGWQAHTVRAALTGLRKAGFNLDKQKGDTGSIYSLPA
ncbi:uncharacterized protein DUF3489 [Stella humosa]|uniref:Uncharacterized protein DUF3489 n=1 Tax=Stella humosa TaxID=94 RepID=A0A3N1KTN2_9PROT|nr:DUF3489 domain-containing protein [Stella humosa]ROP83951.1 uncharacterized protein DUF3489 [Stella humosa]BBK33459.1 hypothetical protein STHU_40930 [Stella humosa]